jgi:DNA-directed RNA polymerase specialized sigma24 family protein
MGPSPDPDRELVQKAQDGDRSAFNQLVLKYRNRVMGIATRMVGDRTEAEDLAQDVFVRVFHGLEDFQGEALFSTWLYRIVANSCLTKGRSDPSGQGSTRALRPPSWSFPTCLRIPTLF